MARNILVHALHDMLRDVAEYVSLFGGNMIVFGEILDKLSMWSLMDKKAT